MKIDIRRIKNNKFSLIFLLLGIFSMVLGYILLVTLDNVGSVEYKQMVYSVYTVISQFGPLVFSPIIINNITEDYKNKNIVFYKASNYSPITYLT